MTCRGYIGQVAEVRPILADMEDRGLPVDDAERLAVDVEFRKAQMELGLELAGLAPPECSRIHPKVGYKGTPPEVKGWGGDLTLITATRFNDEDDLSGQFYHYEIRRLADQDRWCRVYDFNANSSQQLLSYMKAKGHPIPKSRKNEDAEGNARDTTEKKELVRLAHKTGDTFYLKTIEFREFGKMRGTYVEGFKPGPDGRVHTTFTFGTGTGQLAARNPNITNFPKRMRLAKRVRKMIAAPPGKILVEVDYRAYHVLTTGFCAEDATFMRLARLDMHSFVAWHMLKLPGADALISLPDDELAAKLAWFKSDPERKFVRDNQAKPGILGIGFGMGYRRLFQENMEYFENERQAKRLHELLQALVPRVFAWQGEIRKKAHEERKLVSPFGHIRRFYEVFRWDGKTSAWAPGDQAEEAVAFLPANIAFGNIRETMKELARRHLDSLYGLCNNVHDSFVWCFPQQWLDRFLADVIPVLTAPSKVLRHPVLAPGGLTVDVECSAGPNWSEMADIPLPKAPVVAVDSQRELTKETHNVVAI